MEKEKKPHLLTHPGLTENRSVISDKSIAVAGMSIVISIFHPIRNRHPVLDHCGDGAIF